MPIGRNVVTQAKVQRQVPPKFEIILNIIGLYPAKEVDVRVACSDFRIVADAQKHTSQRKPVARRR